MLEFCLVNDTWSTWKTSKSLAHNTLCFKNKIYIFRFFENWEKFKNNNQYVNKILDWKVKYDESDNPVIRASRLLTEKLTDVVGGIFQKTELSETLTEIVKMDPTFDKNKFLAQCATDFIPNILEAIVRGDLDVLRDWCHEGPYNILSTPLKQAKTLGYLFHSKVCIFRHNRSSHSLCLLIIGSLHDKNHLF